MVAVLVGVRAELVEVVIPSNGLGGASGGKSFLNISDSKGTIESGPPEKWHPREIGHAPIQGVATALWGPRVVRASSEECSPRRSLLPAGPAGLTPRLRGGSWLDHSSAPVHAPRHRHDADWVS